MSLLELGITSSRMRHIRGVFLSLMSQTMYLFI